MALNHSQYDAIIRLYDQKQIHSRKELEERHKFVWQKVPRIKEIENEISSLSVEQAKKLISGDNDALPDLKRKLHALIFEKTNLLKKEGFPDNYLEPHYECPDCQDTGYINNEKCHCFRKAEIELLYSQSNLQSVLTEENFNTFSFNYYSNNFVDRQTGKTSLENIKGVHHICMNFVEKFPQEFQNLLFYGDTGVGKTFLSHCIAKEIIDKSHSVIYFTAFELFDIMAKSVFEKDSMASVIYEHLFDCDLLIIDDLGTEMVNSFTSSQLFHCINERLLRKKATIISTNLSFESLKEIYSERTFSRITSNYTLLKITGDDIRIKKKLLN